MITINRSGLIGKVFLFCHRLRHQFVGRAFTPYETPERTDLCSMLRVILIVAPLALAVNLAAISFALGSVGYLLFVLWLNVMVVGWVTFILASLAAGAAILVATLIGAGRLTETITRAEVTREAVDLVRTFYQAKKSYICPLISIDGGSR